MEKGNDETDPTLDRLTSYLVLAGLVVTLALAIYLLVLRT